MTVSAELLVFSGNPNPVFALDDGEAVAVAAGVAQAVASGLSPTDQDEQPVLGYRGFRLSADDGVLGDTPDVLVAGGTVVLVTPEGAQAAVDSAGVQGQLVDAARRHGFGDILDELGVSSGNV